MSLPGTRPDLLPSALRLAASLLILKVTLSIVGNYPSYFPPDFHSDFLRGRERHFTGLYRAAFYTHIASGPPALLIGLVLVSERFRRRFSNAHRLLGRIQVVGVAGLLAPSGLWMAWYSRTGPIGSAGLALLAVATGTCAVLGWRSALRQRFADHRRWMWRTFLLLNSAVVLRLLGGLASLAVLNPDWADPLAIWASGLAPAVAFEAIERTRRPRPIPALAG